MLPLILALQAAPAAAPAPPAARPAAKADVEHTPRDWAATLRTDARALHDDIAANHPGPVNKADPGFAKRNEAQLALALKRARTTRTYGDYFFALRWYAASFDDGHLGLGSPGSTPWDGAAWPGFLTNFDEQGVQRVVIRADDAPLPLGAALVGCDDRPADRLAAEIVAPQVGRWMLDSQRQAFGSLVFASKGNRYVHRPKRCMFLVDGRRRTLTLDWRPVVAEEQIARLNAARHRASYTFAARTLPDGTRWYGIPSFNADPDSTAAKTLPGMIARMQTDRDALAAAPAIVLDLRGNGGGSSDWSYQMAKILWGPAALERLPAEKQYVDWRASPANLHDLEEGYEQRRGKGMSPDSDRWFRTTIAGLRGAIARGDALWRAPDEDDEAPPGSKPAALTPRPLAGRVYLLTDGSCGSACLDAVDLWRALGAVHVGRTTSADTLYMDVRRYTLPSGLANGSMAMKVYRGRPRGANQPVVPTYAFDGDITDTARLETWIAGLRPARPNS